MKELFSTYSLKDIVMIVILIALAIKEFVMFYDWGAGRAHKVFIKMQGQENQFKDIQQKLGKDYEEIYKLKDNQNEMVETLKMLDNKINNLTESDKEDIKSYITEQHHKFVYDKKWIDDYTLDCLERRYKRYIKEGGNSFISDLMNEIRKLPKIPPTK